MKISDSRSGEVMTPGKIVTYGGGEKIRVIDVDEGLFSARALIHASRVHVPARRLHSELSGESDGRGVR